MKPVMTFFPRAGGLLGLLGRLGLLGLGLLAGPAAAAVLISQVYGGGGNSGASWRHDHVELRNTGPTAVNLAGWTLQYASASGSFNASGSTALAGSIAPGGFHLVRLASGGAVGAELPVAADSLGSANLSASSGKLALVSSTTLLAGTCPLADATVVDFVGYGSPNCSRTSPAPAGSNTLAVQRLGNGCQDSGSNGADFATGTLPPRGAASGVQACGSGGEIVAVCPAFAVVQGLAGSSTMSASDSDGQVNAVALTAGAVPGLALQPLQPAGAPGAAARVRVAAAASLATGSYPITLRWDNDQAQSATCNTSVTVQAPPALLTSIPAIQGNGSSSPLLGSSRTVRGIVTAVLPGLRGWFVQDETGDGDPATSDGLFVFNGALPIAVEVGERVQVTGTVVEFAGFAGNPTVTELVSPSALAKLGLGQVAPTVVALPEAQEGELERHEGMLVTLTGPLTVSQNFFQGRYGQVTLAAQGRLFKPTQWHRPGTPAALAMADDNARRRIVLDDGASSESFFSGVENPAPIPYIGADNTLRAGDTVAAVTGVIDFGRITSGTGAEAIVDYKIHPTVAPLFTRVNTRPAAPAAVGGTHRVGSFNVLNWFTTFGDGSTASGGSGAGCLPSGTTADCRGADNLAEFVRQRDKIVRAIAALDADVLGLMELQRNGGAATQALVDALNAHVGAGTWAVVPEPATGVGTDAIQVGLIYRPARVQRVGAALSDTAAIHNRPPLAQAFEPVGGGARVLVVVNHFKSKGCDGATGAELDAGDGQGCFNSRRVLQAQALRSFVSSALAQAGTASAIVLGDLNAYAQEDPVHTLTSDGFLADQAARFGAATDHYSFVFDGEAGALDHALASAAAAARVTGVAHWHINTDEPSVIDYNTDFKPQDLYTVSPWRASDHDPVLIGLNLAAAVAQPQTISFTAPGGAPATSTVALVASASSGLPVAFSSVTPAVCSVVGTQATLLTAGTCTIAADQPGNTLWLPAPQVQRSFAVTLAVQTLQFDPLPPRAVGMAAFAPAVSASSGLPVTLQSLSPAVCGVAAGQVSLLAPGTCLLQASQAGNATWAPAVPVQRGFTVLPAGGAGDGDVPLPAWALLLLAGGLGAALRRGGRA